MILIVVASSDIDPRIVHEPNFFSTGVNYKLLICRDRVSATQKNFKKWQDAYLENPNYPYYMLLHDDSVDFQLLWLDAMKQVLDAHPDTGAVCHQLYSPGGQEAWYDNGNFGYCKCSDPISLYGNDPATQELIWNVLNFKFGSHARFSDLAGGEQVLIKNECLSKMQAYGGIPVPENLYLENPQWTRLRSPIECGPLVERIFSGFINSLGYRIRDCLVNGRHPFRHKTLGLNDESWRSNYYV